MTSEMDFRPLIPHDLSLTLFSIDGTVVGPWIFCVDVVSILDFWSRN